MAATAWRATLLVILATGMLMPTVKAVELEAPPAPAAGDAEAPVDDAEAPADDAKAPADAPAVEAEAPADAPAVEAEAPATPPAVEAEAPVTPPAVEANAPDAPPTARDAATETPPEGEADKPESLPPEVMLLKAQLLAGIEDVQAGRRQEAMQKFEGILKTDPSAETAHRLVDQTTFRFFIRMAIDDGDKTPERAALRKFAHRILALADQRDYRVRINPVEIAKLMEQTLSKDFREKLLARQKLSRADSMAVPLLLPWLTARDRERQSNAKIILTAMGERAALPLAQILRARDLGLKLAVLPVLARIADPRTLAPVRAVQENPEEPPALRKLAQRALEAITEVRSPVLPRAAALYLKRAEDCYYNAPGAFFYYEKVFDLKKIPDARVPLWSWSDKEQKLVYQAYPLFAYRKALAEQACADGLRLATDPTPLLAMMLTVRTARRLEAESLLMAAADGKGGLRPTDIRAARVLSRQLSDVDWLARAAGETPLLAALSRALRDEEPRLAGPFVRYLGEVCRPAVLPAPGAKEPGPAAPLIEALTCPMKSVRFAAAAALLQIAGDKPFDREDKVLPALRDALGQWEVHEGVPQAIAIFRETAASIRDVAGAKSRLNMASLVPELTKALRKGPTPVRVYAAQTLLALRTPEVVPAFLESFKDKESPEPLRLACLAGITRALRGSDVPPAIRRAAYEALFTERDALRMGVAALFGQSGVTPQEAVALYALQCEQAPGLETVTPSMEPPPPPRPRAPVGPAAPIARPVPPVARPRRPTAPTIPAVPVEPATPEEPVAPPVAPAEPATPTPPVEEEPEEAEEAPAVEEPEEAAVAPAVTEPAEEAEPADVEEPAGDEEPEE